MILFPTAFDYNPIRIVSAIMQIAQGRSNAVGTVTLAAGAGTTVVAFDNCSEESQVFLSPKTANASAAVSNVYVSSIGNGTFTLTHANNAQTDRTFGFACLG